MQVDDVTFTPLPGRLVVAHVYNEEKTKAGVWVARLDQERTQVAVVLDPGETEFEVGDWLVLSDHYVGTDFCLLDEPMCVIEYEDVLGFYDGDYKDLLQ